jgi:hypothetical protein
VSDAPGEPTVGQEERRRGVDRRGRRQVEHRRRRRAVLALRETAAAAGEPGRIPLGATGAIYALRRSLYRQLPSDTILDDVLTPMRAVLAGYRVVFTSARRVRSNGVRRAGRAAPQDSHARRNFQVLCRSRAWLLPVVNPVWLQYLSHKVGRLLVPYALFALFVANVAIAPGRVFYP